MINVLFICAANINRSPMAEAIFRSLLKSGGLNDRISVDSAATGNGHIGEPPFWGTQQILRKHEIPFSGITARQVTQKDIDDSQYIIAMDEQNIRNLRNMGFNVQIYRLAEFAPEFQVSEVPDPSYTNDWEGVFRLIDVACRHLLEFVRIREKL